MTSPTNPSDGRVCPARVPWHEWAITILDLTECLRLAGDRIDAHVAEAMNVCMQQALDCHPPLREALEDHLAHARGGKA